jgi:maleate isomerase
MTPSSNTILEPVTASLLQATPHITAHFQRLRVTHITLDESSANQFDASQMLPAAEMLSDAKVHAIAWNGTSASWLGFERDEILCAAVKTQTGISATSSTLAYRHAFRRYGAKKIGLVTPYTDKVQKQIIKIWADHGFDCSNEMHLGWSDNFSFAEANESMIGDMIHEVAKKGCDAVAILCTNLYGARICSQLEKQYSIPLVDSVAVTLWHSLELAGAPCTPTIGGRIFTDPAFQKNTA